MNIRVNARHRLSQDENVGNIIWVTDHAEINLWLQNSKNLKGKNSTVTISPDHTQS